MGSTPNVLVKRFSLPEEMGRRPIARSWHAFRGTRKSDRRRFLLTIYPSIMSGALSAEGAPLKWKRPIGQEDLAAAAGAHRTTFTRRLSRFAAPAESARRKHETSALPVLWRSRRFAEPNEMGDELPRREYFYAVVETQTGKVVRKNIYLQRSAAIKCEELQQQTGRRHQVELIPCDPHEYHAPALEQLITDNNPRTEWWDQNFDMDGHKSTSCWIWDSRLMDPDDPTAPLGGTERLVMSAYEHFGLLEEWRKGHKVTKARGFLQIHQQEVADYCGISVRTLYEANCKWERLGVLRIATDPREPGSANGVADRWTAGPMKVIYLPMKPVMSDEEARQEADRLNARLAGIVAREGEQRLAQLKRIQAKHAELLKAWTSSERQLMSLWATIKRDLRGEVDAELLRECFPTLHPRE